MSTTFVSILPPTSGLPPALMGCYPAFANEDDYTNDATPALPKYVGVSGRRGNQHVLFVGLHDVCYGGG